MSQNTLINIGKTIIIVALATVFILLINKLGKKKVLASDKYSSKNGTKDPVPFIVIQIVSVLLAIFAGIGILDAWGFNVTQLFAGLGIASAIIGLALQDTIKDIIMGSHLYHDRYFTTGDYIEYEGNVAKVETFSLRTTRLRLIDNSIISVSNRNLTTIKMAGEYFSYEIPVSYEEDRDKTNKVLTEITEDIARLPEMKAAFFKGVKAFEDSAIVYVIVGQTEPQNIKALQFEGYNLILRKLTEAGFEIPFRQLDIHMDTKG